jgi:hypothetical protein
MSFALGAKILCWTAAALLAAFHPFLGESLFHRTEALARRLASHGAISCLASGLLVLLIRAALLPWWPIPKPAIYDEFSYILQADTFAHGRLTNPAHPLWRFFESAYVLQQPTYASKYPPAQALFMALGQALFGDPWFGVWLSCGIMAAALVWAMQGWLPPGWALFGGMLALPLAIFTYWMNSYWGGAVAAIGGALLLGGYARVVKQNRAIYALAIGIGIAILANTRPYEGLIFTIPVAIAFLVSRPRWSAIALLTSVLIPAFAATGYYNRAVTGNAFQLPFTEYARQYAHIPLFNFQPLQPARTDLTPAMYDLHQNWEPGEWRKARSLQLIRIRLDDWKSVAATLLGSSLMGLLILAFLPNLWRDRRIRLPLICVVTALAGSLIEVRYYQHYAAPAAAALLILTVQAFRHLLHWKPTGVRAGQFLTRAIPILVVGAAVGAQGLMILRHEPPENSQPRNARRDEVVALLSEFLDKHVILVRYTGQKSPHEEWVYNGADIDAQDVIWAHDLGPAQNARLLEYYKGRKIWLFQPDGETRLRLDPYGVKP